MPFAVVSLALGAFLTEGGDAQLLSLPLIKQADIVQAWFAGRAYFNPEQRSEGEIPSRTARWSALRPGDCSMEGSAITIRRDGSARFVSRVRSKDDGDRYCVILDFFDRSQFRLWRSPETCTPFELTQDFTSWIISDLSFPEAQYQFIAFALREDRC
jgi:hypothetical protein